MIGKFPEIVLNETGNQQLAWGKLTNKPEFIDIISHTDYAFSSGYKIYDSTGELWVSKNAPEPFDVKWKDALSLAAQSAATITVLFALL